MWSCGEAIDAAGCAGERAKHQHEDEREDELGAARHQHSV
jgi:hypothetical protein